MRLFAALLIALLLLGSAAGVGVGQPPDDRVRTAELSDTVTQEGTKNTTTIDDNNTSHAGTTMRIALRDDGDARWNVTTRFVLRDENETEAFRELATEYENGGADVGFAPDTFERIADRTTTDREMTVASVDRSAELRDNSTLGVLTLSFTWTNFTRMDDGQILLDDAFTTESGTWLPVLSEDQRLIIEGPDGYVVQDTPKGVTNFNELHYEGPQAFEPGDITVVYAPRSNTETQTETQTETPSGGLSEFGGLPGVALLLFVVGGLGAYAWTQRRDDPGVAETARARATATGPESPDESDRSAASEVEGNDEGEEDDVELLSDEERVLRLLRQNDGRMKQAKIVSETKWSNAKVSQLLSKMDDDEQVDKLRIGRENLITLPDEDVTDTD
ncbi:hypothetical protein NGM10_09325 [Halorussus salilacus]|uniref:helix-turn-helix transcriptional regulator n=1 Tax=Halorussus salilacus TaxID=2953750 RepID=UPI00209EDD11|nr:hypothetical protein [Halorussus salilacus]USZ66932.1 hypothetical protein NGM10_09325 [Halorussus salilacus]